MNRNPILSLLLAAALAACVPAVGQVARPGPVTAPPGAKPVAVTAVGDVFVEGADVGVYESGAACRGVRRLQWGLEGMVDLSTSGLAGVFRTELEANGWRVAETSARDFKEHTASGGELLVAGQLTHLEAAVCGRDGKGSALMGVDWQVYDTGRGTVVGTFHTMGSASITGDSVPDAGRKLMEASFAAAVANLLADDGFRATVE